jgi:uncharacterized protein with PIN domain
MEHNNQVYDLYSKLQAKNLPAGVKCDNCDTEMLDVSGNVVLASYPPKKKVECPKCGHSGYMVI